MKISTEIASISNIVGEEKAIELVAKAEFDGWDYTLCGNLVKVDWKNGKLNPVDTPISGSNYVKYAEHLKRIGLDNGIACNQAHAPFPIYFDGMEKYIYRAIECAGICGAKICVVHPDNNKSAKENAEFYHRILPFAKECGVKIATENMWNWNFEKDTATAAACSNHGDFLAHILAVNDPYLVACLDIGHAEMRGLCTDAVTMIKTLGSHIQALHIHDNDKHRDCHQIPFSMDIDYAPIARALAEIGYGGYFTLEANEYMKRYTESDAITGVRLLKDSARKFADMTENFMAEIKK